MKVPAEERLVWIALTDWGGMTDPKVGGTGVVGFVRKLSNLSHRQD